MQNIESEAKIETTLNRRPWKNEIVTKRVWRIECSVWIDWDGGSFRCFVSEAAFKQDGVDGSRAESCDFRDELVPTTAAALFPCNSGSQPSSWGRAGDNDARLGDNDEREE